MAINLRSALKENTRSAMESLHQLSLDEIDGRTLTFDRVDIRHTVKIDRETMRPQLDENGNQIALSIPIVVFKEIPDAFLSCSSTVISRIMNAFLEAVGGDIGALNEAFAAEDYRVMFKYDERPKPGKNPTMFVYEVD